VKRLFFVIFYSLLINWGLVANTENRILNLKKEAEQAFYTGNFKQSQRQLYLLSRYYKTLSDSANLCKTWVGISFLDHLMNRTSHAMAALRIAKRYQTCKDDYFDLGLLYTKGNSGTDNCSSVLLKLKRFDGSFLYKVGIVLCIQEFKSKKNGLTESKTDELIAELSMKKDTLWCGFRNLLFEKGKMLHNRMDYKKCLGYFLRAIQISEKINSVSHESIWSYKYIMGSLAILGEEEQRTYYFNRFITLYEDKLTDKKLNCEYLIIKGAYYYVNRMYPEANIAYELSIQNKRESGLDFNNEIYYLISSSFYMGDYRKVIEWSLVYNGIKDSYYQFIVAYSYLKIGKIDLACKLEKEINKSEFISNNENRLHILYMLSLFYKEIKNYKSSEQFLHLYLNKTIKLFTNNQLYVARAYGSTAYFYWTVKGDIDRALNYYQHELCILLQEAYHNDYFKLPDISKSIQNENLAVCLRNRGEAFLELAKQQKTKKDKIKYLEACLDNFDLAFQALNKYKFTLLSEEKQLLYTNLTRHYYSYVIECCYQLYKISGDKEYANQAFTYIEKSKASVLLSIMKGTEAKKLKMVPEWVIRKEDYIKKNTVKYAKLIIDENNKVSPEYALIDQYNNSLQKLNLQQDTLMKEIKDKFPAYYRVKYGAEVASVSEVQQRLKPDQVLVQYALTKTNIFLVLVSKDSYQIIKESIDTSFTSEINKYRKSISQFNYEDVKDASIYAYSATAYRLFQTLLAPVEGQISGKELIIIPDDILNTIPFEALLTQKVEKVKDIAYKDLPYLIKRNSIIYNYSASLFAQSLAFNEDKIDNPRLLAMAPIHSAFTLSDINKITRDSDEIVPIPGTIDEVKGICKIFSGKKLFGKNASEARFKQICDQYQIIHIASHGFVNNEYPLFSRLVFNRNNQDTLNDGLLNTYEIYNMHISAPLVVLSACNTGSGKLYKGEGTISLARGFYVAGAKNIIMTLWAITDKTSNELVQQFYTHLANSEPVPVSLQQAKLGFLQNSDEIAAHPFFWAGYISIGEPEVRFAAVSKSRHYFWMAAAGFILLTSLFLFWRMRRGKSL
jgi:CHAT domain-containing protein